jgi:aryl-alcohol dehydrogenase-like predicted oxidoreductase
MNYVRLGKTALQVSELCLGTMNFGQYTSEQDAFRIMDEALELGCNFFDTANVYGFDKGRGLTEEIIGRWFAQGGNRRNNIVLATKVYSHMSVGPNKQGLSAYAIRKECEASLRRLQTDHIDLYQMHHIDRAAPWEEVYQAMEVLVQQGKITYLGSSNFAAWNIAQAQEIARSRNFLGLVSEQSVYSLRNRHIELEVIPACRNYSMAVIPWSPLAGGLLCGVFNGNDGHRRARPALMESAERLRPQIERYEALCAQYDIACADVALAWVRQQPGVTSPIIGPRTIEQLRENVQNLTITLSEPMLQELNTIWPGPGNQAPEAYAW